MEIRTTQAGVNVLEATARHYLYKKSEGFATAYFTRKVYLGKGDNMGNYAETTEKDVAEEMLRRESGQENLTHDAITNP